MIFIAFILLPLFLGNTYITCYSPTHVFCYSRMGSCTIYHSLRGHVVCLFTPTGQSMTFFTALFGALFFSATCPRSIAPRSGVPLTHYSPLHNSLFSFLPNSGPFFTQSPYPFFRPITFLHLLLRHGPLDPTRNTLFILQSASRWRSAHNSTLLTSTTIAQHYIPLYTAAPTFPTFFPKISFSKFFGALSRGPRGFCPLLSNSLTPAAYPQIFSDVSTFIFASFFTVLPSIYFLV